MEHEQTTDLFGIPFDRRSAEEVAALIGDRARSGERLWISTANLDWVVMADRDPEFRKTLLASDLVTCDGAPVMILSRIAGKPLPHRVTGVELFKQLRAGRGGALRVGFFGAEGDEAERASAALNAEDGPLVGAGGYNPGHGSIDDLSTDEHIHALNSMEADLLVLALGAKKAQSWTARNLYRLDAPAIAHLGAVVRHVSGDTQEAPSAMSRIGMEWVWRAMHEPALRRRYAQNFAALPGLMLKARQERR